MAPPPAITWDFTYRRAPTTPVASATWQQVAALRLERQHLTERVEPDALVDVARDLDIEGQRGWVRSADVKALTKAEPSRSVRLLPGFDPYINELPRKTDALLPVDREALVRRTAGWVTPGGKGAIEVQPFGKLRRGAGSEIKAEAERLAAFLDRSLGVRVKRQLT